MRALPRFVARNRKAEDLVKLQREIAALDAILRQLNQFASTWIAGSSSRATRSSCSAACGPKRLTNQLVNQAEADMVASVDTSPEAFRRPR